MPINGTYDVDSDINPEDQFLGVSSETGQTVQYTMADITRYIASNGLGRIAVYDGATDLAAYSQAITYPTPRQVRLGLSGALTNETNFPSNYGSLLVNQYSIPAGTSFDFRFLPQGLVLSFDIAFKAKVTTDGGALTASADNPRVLVEFEVPNGDIQRRIVQLYSDYEITTGVREILDNYFQVSFSTFINDEVLDSLLGGQIRVSLLDELTSPNIITLYNATVTVRI